MYQIRFIPADKLDEILPFLQLLNPNEQEQVLADRLQKMKSLDYRCIGIYDGEKLAGISGLWILFKHYSGKHAEPDNVIIHPDYRGKGLGEKLIGWIHDYAKEQGCESCELNCYVSNHAGVRFWISLGYEIIGYHMIKKF